VKVNETPHGERPADPPAMKSNDATRVIRVGSRPHDWCNLHALELNVGEACPLCRQDGAQHRSTENDRWWQAFSAVVASALHNGVNTDELVSECADNADAMIKEAERRGRI
jgi:hypothetical protein